MSPFKTILTSLAFIVLCLASVSRAKADTIIIGGTGTNSVVPFGTSSGFNPAGSTYQQIYSSNGFSGPVTITQIAFSSAYVYAGQNGGVSNPGIATYNFDIRLSNTASTPSAPDGNFAANRGANFTTVFSGPLTAVITNDGQFDLVIPITPFSYDPIAGNLLLDVFLNAQTTFTGTLGNSLAFVAGQSSDVGRPFYGGNSGLLTSFTTTNQVSATPEPATMILLGTGLAGIAAQARRKRRTKTSAKA